MKTEKYEETIKEIWKNATKEELKLFAKIEGIKVDDKMTQEKCLNILH